MLVNSMWGNLDIRPLGMVRGGVRENPDVITLKLAFSHGWIWTSVVPCARLSHRPEWHHDWFNCFHRAHGRD